MLVDVFGVLGCWQMFSVFLGVGKCFGMFKMFLNVADLEISLV